MLTAECIKAYAKSLSIPACGVCSAKRDEQLAERLQKQRARYPYCEFEEKSIEKRVTPRLLMPSAQSVFVCIFPYYIEEVQPENLARFASVRDYHRVVRQYLAMIADFICRHEPQTEYTILCDTAPLADRQLAYRAGLGFWGKNHMLIHPLFGSYFCIGALLLSLPLQADAPLRQQCGGCNACIRACPGGALTDDFGFDCEKCISYITQKKEITEHQMQLLRGQNSVYGCDVCQNVCPHNQMVPNTPIREFYADVLPKLEGDALAAMSGRSFKRAYADYAFSWCSLKTLLKNFPEDMKHGDFITGRQL